MKKIVLSVILVLFFSLISWSKIQEERQYVNLSFTVWQLENGVAEAACKINTPIPEVFRESWIYEFVSFDVTDRKTVTKAVEKEGLRFVLTAEYKDRLKIQIFEKGKEFFRLVHSRPSTMDTIFCGSDRMTYMMEVTYTAGNHKIGLLSPGILKK